jgi:GTP cyclohydrolase IA
MPDEPVSKTIRNRIEAGNGRFWAGDNVSKYLEEGDKQKLIEELTPKFESVIDSVD